MADNTDVPTPLTRAQKLWALVRLSIPLSDKLYEKLSGKRRRKKHSSYRVVLGKETTVSMVAHVARKRMLDKRQKKDPALVNFPSLFPSYVTTRADFKVRILWTPVFVPAHTCMSHYFSRPPCSLRLWD